MKEPSKFKDGGNKSTSVYSIILDLRIHHIMNNSKKRTMKLFKQVLQKMMDEKETNIKKTEGPV